MSAYNCIFWGMGLNFSANFICSPDCWLFGTNPASPTTTGSCKLFIASKLPLLQDSQRASSRGHGPPAAGDCCRCWQVGAYRWLPD